MGCAFGFVSHLISARPVAISRSQLLAPLIHLKLYHWVVNVFLSACYLGILLVQFYFWWCRSVYLPCLTKINLVVQSCRNLFSCSSYFLSLCSHRSHFYSLLQVFVLFSMRVTLVWNVYNLFFLLSSVLHPLGGPCAFRKSLLLLTLLTYSLFFTDIHYYRPEGFHFINTFQFWFDKFNKICTRSHLSFMSSTLSIFLPVTQANCYQ